MCIVCKRVFSVVMALAVALTVFIPAAGVSAFSQVAYVPMPPGNFIQVSDKPNPVDIYYDDAYISDTGPIIIDTENAYKRVSTFFGDFNGIMRVIVVANHAQHVQILRLSDLPADNVSGNWGDGVSGTIVIEAQGQVPDFSTSLAYQMAFIETRTWLGGNKYSMPGWFSEGLAAYASGNITDSTRNMVNGLYKNNKMMSVSEMENIMEHSADSSFNANDLSMANAQADLLVEYLAKQYGNDTVKKIMTSFGATGNLTKAFTNSISYTPEEVNMNWEASLGKAYNQDNAKATAHPVYGYVLDQFGEPLANGDVYFMPATNVSSSSLHTTTDSLGYYALNLTYGNYTVHADVAGSSFVDDSISLRSGYDLPFNISLSKAGVAVDTPSATESRPSSVSGRSDNLAGYALLLAVNAVAILLIAFLFHRHRVHK